MIIYISFLDLEVWNTRLNQKLKRQDEMERRLNVAMRGGVVRGD